MSIDLYCDGHLDNAGEPTHDRWVLARWKRIDGKWTTTKRVSEPGEPLRLLKGKVVQQLHGDETIDRFEDWRTDSRFRYQFSCPVCSLGRRMRQTPELETKLAAILDALDTAGASSLPLRVLIATI
jgi:hypothetical protein